ncbi:MAG: phosphonate ABC transporter, permease protein PhnE [Clostridia bacterium]|nr:phosphonate ABC transporter, permease protein PhnE [Clostridia bacterium]
MNNGNIREPGFNYLNYFIALVILGAVIYSAKATDFSPGLFLDPGNLKAMGRFIGGLWPPETGYEFLASTFKLIGETIAISIIGTALAVLVAFPLSILATRLRGEEFSRRAVGTPRWILRWGGYYLARTVLNLFRGVPELMWALIFVVAVGLGPFPGVLALAAHSTGVLGKLYSELFESVDQRLVETVRATGADELKVLLYNRLPVTLPVFLSYTLFRWECNMRAATILGFVGAGGIGTQLMISMKLFAYSEVMTLVLEIMALVILVDLAGQFIRTRILDAPSGTNSEEQSLVTKIICSCLPSGQTKDPS